MKLSAELEPLAGSVHLIRHEWVERVRKMERIAELAGQIGQELEILRLTNDSVRAQSRLSSRWE